MEHWLNVLRKEEKRIWLYEHRLKQKGDPALDSRINELETADKGLKSILDSQEHSHKTCISELLKNPSIFNALAGAIGDYNRALFRLKRRLDDNSNKHFVYAILSLAGSKYSDVSLVAHYDGCIFDPKKEESWDYIRGMNEGEYLSIYAYNPDFSLAKGSVDVMGAMVGDEVEIPFVMDYGVDGARYIGNPDSQLERLTCSDYKFDFKPKGTLKLTADLIDDIISAVHLPNSNQINRGTVDLVFENRVYNARDSSQMCMLNGKNAIQLNFIFKGGYVKDASNTLFNLLSQAAVNPPKSE
jgi:hypothetical protein